MFVYIRIKKIRTQPFLCIYFILYVDGVWMCQSSIGWIIADWSTLPCYKEHETVLSISIGVLLDYMRI